MSPPTHGISKALLRSSNAAVFSQFWRMAVVFATHILLRRLVEPAPWGLWHWAEPIFLLIGQLRDLGLPGHMVRHPAPRPYGNFLRLEGLGMVVTAVLVWIGAPWLASSFKEADPTEVTAVVRLLVLFLLFEGLAKVPLTFFEAELRIEQSFLPELLRNATYAVVALALAIDDHGVWCFIVAHVAGGAVFAATLWWRAWPDMNLEIDPTIDNRRLLRASLPLVLMSVLMLLLGRIDPLVLGLRFEPEVVGHYGMALFLAFLLSSLVALPVSRALYPALQRLQADRHRFFEGYRLATVLVLALEVPYALSLFINSEMLLAIFGGVEYPRAASGFLQVLCFAPLLQPFSRCANDVLLVRHQDRVLIVSSALTLVSLGVLGFLLSWRFGPIGMAWVNLLPLGSAVVAWAIWRLDPPAFRGLCRDLAWLYILPLPIFLATALALPPGWGRLGLSFGATFLTLGLFAWRYHRDYRRFFTAPAESPVVAATGA